ncbi:MAG: WecB/TagA/CpsF family glycosyltransferase [Candidatus Roizmanbacteria bacterium]|nr:WecB/TagA/CpsF family glycosyltransferase [Candidatus Roizmanbacteria bacterium]
MKKQRLTLFQLPIDPLPINDVLEKIKLYLSGPQQFRHIVSINPENIVIAHQNSSFLEVCQGADLALTDGIGVVIAAKLQGLFIPERVPGSSLLPKLLELAGQMSSRVVLIGSQAKLADNIAKCYSRAYPKATYIGIEGYKNKLNPTPEEEAQLVTHLENGLNIEEIADIHQRTPVAIDSRLEKLGIYLKDSPKLGARPEKRHYQPLGDWRSDVNADGTSKVICLGCGYEIASRPCKCWVSNDTSNIRTWREHRNIYSMYGNVIGKRY